MAAIKANKEMRQLMQKLRVQQDPNNLRGDPDTPFQKRHLELAKILVGSQSCSRQFANTRIRSGA